MKAKAFQVPKRRTAFHVTAVALLIGLVLSPVAVTAAVEEAKVMDVAKELACLCGSCPNRPLDECRCGYAGQQRGEIAAALEKGETKEQILAGFVAEFGERIFVTPPKKGFNLMAWIMPVVGIAFGGFVVRMVMKGWSRKEERVEDVAETALSEEDRAKLDAALKG